MEGNEQMGWGGGGGGKREMKREILPFAGGVASPGGECNDSAC